METTNYMILGFSVVFGVVALHLASLVIRNRSLNRDLEMLEQLNKKPAKKKAGSKKKKSKR